MVGRGRLLVVNITVRDSGSATWVRHCIRTSAMTCCVFRRIIFSHELGRPFFLLLRFFPFFLSLFRFLFFLEPDCLLCAICDTWLRACICVLWRMEFCQWKCWCIRKCFIMKLIVIRCNKARLNLHTAHVTCEKIGLWRSYWMWLLCSSLVRVLHSGLWLPRCTSASDQRTAVYLRPRWLPHNCAGRHDEARCDHKTVGRANERGVHCRRHVLRLVPGKARQRPEADLAWSVLPHRFHVFWEKIMQFLCALGTIEIPSQSSQ